MTRVNIYIRSDLKKRIEARAKELGLSRSNLMRLMALEYIAKAPK